MIRKLLSLRHWKHVFVRSWRLLRSPRVRLTDKLLFAVPVLLYWVLPDVLPLVPVDDIAVTMLASGWFVRWMEGRYPEA